MSLSLFLAYSPIVLAPIAAIVLAVLLQWLLRYPRKQPHAATPSTGTDLVPAAPAPTDKLTWEDVTAHHNPFVTAVVPVLAGGAILLLGIWPFTYLGWGFMILTATPGAAQLAPPWFGNFGYFIGLGIAGLFLAGVGVVIASALVIGLHAMGKCIVWPALCDCGLAESDDEHQSQDP